MIKVFVAIIFVFSCFSQFASATPQIDFETFKSTICKRELARGNDIINDICKDSISKEDLEKQLNFFSFYCEMGVSRSSLKRPGNEKATTKALKEIKKFHGRDCKSMVPLFVDARHDIAMYFAGVANASCSASPSSGKEHEVAP